MSRRFQGEINHWERFDFGSMLRFNLSIDIPYTVELADYRFQKYAINLVYLLL